MEDEVKSFLSALVERESLFLLLISFISVLLIVFNESTIGSHTIKIQPIGINILIITTFLFGGLGIWSLTRKRPTKRQTSEIKPDNDLAQIILSNGKELSKINQEQKGVIQSLKQAINDIRDVAIQERSYASTQILEIIENLNVAFINYQENSLDAQRLALWAQARIDLWIEKIKPEDYPNISEKGNFRLFKEDLIEYLNLFCENIINGVFKTPERKGIKNHFNYAFSYKDALRFIRKQIVSEIENDEFPDFSQRQQQELLDYLDQIIEDI